MLDDEFERKKCPHCKKGWQQPTGYVPRAYPCEDCRGAGVLFLCPECEEWVGEHELGEFKCGTCEEEEEEEEEGEQQ